MKEQLVEFKTAKLAKKKGFHVNICELYYDRRDYNKDWSTVEVFNKRNIGTDAIQAPTQSLLQKWLREKYKISVTVFSSSQESWSVKVNNPSIEGIEQLLYRGEDFYTYEQALEVGLLKVLKLIK